LTPPYPKALTTAVHALVRAGDGAVTREANFAELLKDRIGLQYVEEHRRWLNALEDIVLFAHKSLRKVIRPSTLNSVSGLVSKLWYRSPFNQSELPVSKIPPTDSPKVRPGREP